MVQKAERQIATLARQVVGTGIEGFDDFESFGSSKDRTSLCWSFFELLLCPDAIGIELKRFFESFAGLRILMVLAESKAEPEVRFGVFADRVRWRGGNLSWRYRVRRRNWWEGNNCLRHGRRRRWRISGSSSMALSSASLARRP